METWLIIVLLFCHFLGDYTHLSLVEIATVREAKKIGKPIWPILAHASVHGLLVFISVSAFCGIYIGAASALLETIVHWVIDILKGRSNKWMPSLLREDNIWHWWAFGFDQFLHVVTMVAIAKIAMW